MAQTEFIKELIKGYKDADILMFYPLSDEVDLLPLFYELRGAGHRVYFPVVSDSGMEFYAVSELSDFAPAGLGVMEPEDRSHPYEYGRTRTVCLTPGTAFSEMKQRKGRGKGYYDWFFSGKPDIYKIGVTTEAQMVTELKSNPWDVDMDAVVTEDRIIR